MKQPTDQLVLAPTDLGNFLSCRHLVSLDLAAARGEKERPVRYDALMEDLRARGHRHERAYLERLRYRHVRNPMITSVIVMLGGESLLLGSWPVAGWMLVFLLLLWISFVRFEEPDLERRFGDDYRLYKANVPRWIPRATPWEPSEEAGRDR